MFQASTSRPGFNRSSSFNTPSSQTSTPNMRRNQTFGYGNQVSPVTGSPGGTKRKFPWWNKGEAGTSSGSSYSPAGSKKSKVMPVATKKEVPAWMNNNNKGSRSRPTVVASKNKNVGLFKKWNVLVDVLRLNNNVPLFLLHLWHVQIRWLNRIINKDTHYLMIPLQALTWNT